MMKEKIVLFPGSFDPITLGHVHIIERALKLFDKIIIGIGHNASKQSMFSIEQRLSWIDQIFKAYPQVQAASYQGLTIDFCKKINASFILRGIRFVSDFEYERAIADMNQNLAPEIETVFFTAVAAHSSLSSTLVRDVIRNGGDVSAFLPKEIDLNDLIK